MITGREERFVPVDAIDTEYGDPWVHRGYEPDLIMQFEGIGLVSTPPDNRIAATVTTFTDRRFIPIEDMFIDRAVGAQNNRTGEVIWINPDQAPFGWDQQEQRTIPRNWNRWEQQPYGSIMEVLDRSEAAAPYKNVDAEIYVRHGNPRHRSIFKWPVIGFRPPIKALV